MPLVHAIVLGIVQGLTEFIPVSSSGHLLLVPWLLGWTELDRNPDLKVTFDLALHLGTFVGATAVLMPDLRGLLRDRRRAAMLGIATVPAATIGFVLDAVIGERVTAEWLIGLMLVVFGLVLYAADRAGVRRRAADLAPRDALLLGTAQALALFPGVSRSGATISAGRALGLDRDSAARFSFLMSLPITAGAALYKGIDVMVLGNGLPPGFAAPFAAGVAASAATGFIAVAGLLRLLRTVSFTPFVAYRVIVGAAVIVLAGTGAIA